MKIRANKTFPVQVKVADKPLHCIKDHKYDIGCPVLVEKLEAAGYVTVLGESEKPSELEQKIIKPENKEVVIDDGKPDPVVETKVDPEVKADTEAKMSMMDKLKGNKKPAEAPKEGE